MNNTVDAIANFDRVPRVGRFHGNREPDSSEASGSRCCYLAFGCRCIGRPIPKGDTVFFVADDRLLSVANVTPAGPADFNSNLAVQEHEEDNGG
jgi:hypothetical protein